MTPEVSGWSTHVPSGTVTVRILKEEQVWGKLLTSSILDQYLGETPAKLLPWPGTIVTIWVMHNEGPTAMQS